MPVTCALDIADAGSSSQEEVGALMNLTRERIRQIELSALTKLRALDQSTLLRLDLDDAAPDGSATVEKH
jgi:DNA-directed RNA polymerase sigma subunit (sigma70/sigma32)